MQEASNESVENTSESSSTKQQKLIESNSNPTATTGISIEAHKTSIYISSPEVIRRRNNKEFGYISDSSVQNSSYGSLCSDSSEEDQYRSSSTTPSIAGSTATHHSSHSRRCLVQRKLRKTSCGIHYSTQLAYTSPKSNNMESKKSDSEETIQLKSSAITHQESAECTCGCGVTVPNLIVMVGLPARGKTYISSRLARYLSWIGTKSRVFNLGYYRRKMAEFQLQRHEFFLPDNEECLKMRESISQEALEDVLKYFRSEGSTEEVCAIYDATNTTRERRQKIHDFCRLHQIRVLYIESFCDNQDIIEKNVTDVKLNGPDYRDSGLTKDEALEDFRHRIEHYESIYEPLDEVYDKKRSFLRIFNAGEKYLVNRINGHIQSRVLYYIMNLHTFTNNEHIYFSRHGESQHNAKSLLGGNSSLTERGWQYARALADFMEKENKNNLHVWTSSLVRTKQTSQFLTAPKEEWKCLDEINAGICEDMTYEDVQQKYPEEFAARDRDKFSYRYPKGESYADLVQRLEPVIIELERQRDVLVVGHQAVLRCILGYFRNLDPSEIPYVNVPLHTVIKLTPLVNGCETVEIPLNIDAVNTHRERPSNLEADRSAEEALATTPGFGSVPKELSLPKGERKILSTMEYFP